MVGKRVSWRRYGPERYGIVVGDYGNGVVLVRCLDKPGFCCIAVGKTKITGIED